MALLKSVQGFAKRNATTALRAPLRSSDLFGGSGVQVGAIFLSGKPVQDMAGGFLSGKPDSGVRAGCKRTHPQGCMLRCLDPTVMIC